MIYPQVRDLAADAIPVAATCRVLGFSKQAYYAWRREPVTARDWDDAHLINAALAIHADDPAFGYRLIADELAARGVAAGENRVARCCSPQRIWSVFAKKRGTSRKAGPPVHDDLVERRFTAERPDQLWFADDLAAVAATLNNRPRKTLGWKTPAEAFNEQLLSLQQTGVATID